MITAIARRTLYLAGMLPALFFAQQASAEQLDENCVVNILNRTVQVSPGGLWAMPNVPSTMGQIRARVTCVRDGKTTFGQTDYFTVPITAAPTPVTLPLVSSPLRRKVCVSSLPTPR